MGSIERVLVVDDDVQVQRVALLSLERIGGLAACAASSGEEALELVARDDPHVVLLDVMMPGLDGPATLAALRARGLTTGRTIIFLTGRVDPGDVARLVALGADGVLEKPFDPRTLSRDILAIAGEARPKPDRSEM
ncbi:response regulator [Myxococcota bacterium]|nr:response regulator [Myxococcota bacterium]